MTASTQIWKIPYSRLMLGNIWCFVSGPHERGPREWSTSVVHGSGPRRHSADLGSAFCRFPEQRSRLRGTAVMRKVHSLKTTIHPGHRVASMITVNLRVVMVCSTKLLLIKKFGMMFWNTKSMKTPSRTVIFLLSMWMHHPDLPIAPFLIACLSYLHISGPTSRFLITLWNFCCSR